MARRSLSTSPPPRAPKRARIDPRLTSEDFKNGVMLAPWSDQASYGASLVWGPEIVDKAILHAERTVDPLTGTVIYKGDGKPMFTTHPLEKPYFIYQLGSADPELAVRAAQVVLQDVSGIDLNCGCPKPFSTHAGMGAALLTNPDLLCAILTALRAALPPEITVSAKIRLLPSQEDTLKLVERIVNTGVSALTVHCRTRNMRPRERAVIERMREIVEFVEGMGKGIAVIENGDCVSFEDAKRVKEVTGAHSVMIATAAESNPSVFSPTPEADVDKTIVPAYIRMCKYLGQHWSNCAFSIRQFKGSHPGRTKAEYTRATEPYRTAKSYDDMHDFLGGDWDGESVFCDVERAVAARGERRHAGEETTGALVVASPGRADPETVVRADAGSAEDPEMEAPEPEPEVRAGSELPATPPERRANPVPPGSWAPRPEDGTRTIPAMIAGRDEPTPTPGGGVGDEATV